MIDFLIDVAKAIPGIVRAVARSFPRYRSAREMIAASKAAQVKREPGVIYGVTVNAPPPDGKNHDR